MAKKGVGRKELHRRKMGIGEGGEGKIEVEKGEKRKELLRLKRMSPCPRSNETGIIHPGLEIRALSIAFQHYLLLCIHLGSVYSK